ncbi:bifunctional protein GlmU [Synergistales bacterium]|nr:bifunctional protein GlmU [Synergistales bacterium]
MEKEKISLVEKLSDSRDSSLAGSPLMGVLVMAAGKGSRMKSDLPKVLHNILDKPMLGYLLKTLTEIQDMQIPCAEIAVLVGHRAEQVTEYLKSFPSVTILQQKEQLGTGHAVQTTREWWEKFDLLLVLNGDLPLLKASTIQSLLFLFKEYQTPRLACALISFMAQNPDGYGRVIRSKSGIRIIEHKDASQEDRAVREVNAGCYLFDVQSLSRVIGELKNDNAQKEYYLPDVLTLMNDQGMKISAAVADETEMRGVNTQAELAGVTKCARDAILFDWMEKGVNILDPNAVWVGSDAKLAKGVSLAPLVQIWGDSVVGEDCDIGPNCVLRNARLGARVKLVANVIVEDSDIEDDAKAGPFAYIREKSLLKTKAFAGKFVELKKTTVGAGSKVPHLSYMGDAVLGSDVNIGAGSVTCNYDGKQKHSTKIGDRCFVGSDTMMVAPVSLGSDSMTAAGSVITEDVPDGSLGVGRARQKNCADWVYRKKASE